MKKIFSLILSFSVIICTFSGLSLQADATGWPFYAKTVCLNTVFTDYGSKSDPYSDLDVSYMDVFRFSVPAKGKISFNLKSKTEAVPCFRIYKTSNTEESVWFGYKGSRKSGGYDKSFGGYYSNWSIKLGRGSYYLMTLYGKDAMNISFINKLSYKPDYQNSSITSAKGRKKAVRLSWSKAKRATGYKLQYSTSPKMKKAKKITVKGSSHLSKTIKGLKSRKTYYFRIRAYKKLTVSGTPKTYTKSWSITKRVKTK